MNEIVVGILLSLASVAITLQAIITSKQQNRIERLEGELTALANKSAEGFQMASGAFIEQGKLNKSFFEMLTMHHITLRLPTGVAEEVEKFLKDEK